MLTSFEQVRDWITDNGLKRWVLYRDRNKTEKLLDSASFPSDEADKIAMTEKYLRLNGGTAYAMGATTNAASDLSLVCEIRLQEAQPAAVNGMGYAPQPVDEDKIAARIETKLRAEYERKEYERRLADLEKREKELRENENSAMGALTHYFAPIGKALLQRGMLRNVAGVDAKEPVQAQAIQALHDDEPETQVPDTQEPEDDVFTDEESNRLFELMKRFKAVEPQYLDLIENVVVMAENGDATYTMAKGFLLK